MSSQPRKALLFLGSIASSLSSAPPEDQCASKACRRLLASSAAYRLAVRRLLLQKLSGAAQATSATSTGPVLVKTLRSIVSNPSEVDAGGAASAADTFTAGAGRVSPLALRSGQLVDVVKVGMSILASAQPVLDPRGLDNATARTLKTILNSGMKYTTTMADNEAGPTVNSSDVALQVLGTNLAADKVQQYSIVRVLSPVGANYSVDGLSISVIRLNPGRIGLPDADQGITSETVGVTISYSSNLSASASAPTLASWTCPAGGRCIEFQVKVFLSDLLATDRLRCSQWDTPANGWDLRACETRGVGNASLSGSAANNASLYSLLLGCVCASDGIFKASALPAIVAVVRAPPTLGMELKRAFDGGPVLVVMAVAIFLIICGECFMAKGSRDLLRLSESLSLEAMKQLYEMQDLTGKPGAAPVKFFLHGLDSFKYSVSTDYLPSRGGLRPAVAGESVKVSVGAHSNPVSETKIFVRDEAAHKESAYTYADDCLYAPTLTVETVFYSSAHPSYTFSNFTDSA
jgi:hypothetical protein